MRLQNMVMMIYCVVMIIRASTVDATGAMPSDDILACDSFPQYERVVAAMQKMVVQHPRYASIRTIGTSERGESILQLIITDLTGPVGKPVHCVTGATHGNEKTTTLAVLRIAQRLLEGQGTVMEHAILLGSAEFHLIPVLNVDGYKSHQRLTASHKDINRGSGWQVGYNNNFNTNDDHSRTTAAFATSEGKAYRNALMRDTWYTVCDFHTGVVRIIVPWFCDREQVPADDENLKALAAAFCASNGSMIIDNGGFFETYGVPGILTDYAYESMGTQALCVELTTNQTRVPQKNIRELIDNAAAGYLAMTAQSMRGVSGRLYDRVSKKPVCGRVTIDGRSPAVYSNAKSGYFFNHISSAATTHRLNIVANGYAPVERVVRTSENGGFVFEDIALTPVENSTVSGMALAGLRCFNRPSNNSIHACLESRDGKGLDIVSAGDEAFCIIDFGVDRALSDVVSGNDFTVFNLTPARFTVSVAACLDDFEAPSIEKIEGRGITGFDMRDFTTKFGRYIRIAAVDTRLYLDAVEAATEHHVEFQMSLKSKQSGVISLIPQGRTLFSAGSSVLAQLSHRIMGLSWFSGQPADSTSGTGF